MRITTKDQANCVSSILNEHSLSIAEKHVLNYVQDKFLRHAENSAYTWAPDGRTNFLYQEVVQYLPFDIMSDRVVKLLADVDITFENATIKGIFPVIKS